MNASNTTLSNIDFYYFTYYIVSTFARWLDNTSEHYYEKLDDKWWYCVAEEFVPIIESDEKVHIKLYDKVMTEIEPTLTAEQKDTITLNQNNILEQVKVAIYRFITRNTQVCYCGDEDCDDSCGVQPCGCCIDSIKCNYYDYDTD